MGANYTTGALAQDVARIATRAQALLDLVEGGFPDGDAQSTATDIVGITKELDSIRDTLLATAKVLRRGARHCPTLHALAEVTGKSADPAAFVATCGAEALDYLVALRKAGRAECNSFYLECREKVAAYEAIP